jgi:opacity protein-like surface antigen
MILVGRGEEVMCMTRKGLAALAIGMLAVALPLQAQGSKQVEFSLGGGVGVPAGDFDDGFKVGWHGLAAVSYTLPNAPFAFQVDGAFSRFNDEAPGVNLKNNIIYGTGNVLYQIKVSEAARFLPYLIAGGGVYNIDPTGSGAAGLDSRTKFGLNVGAGVAIDAGRVNLFVESRFHDVFDGTGTSDLQFNNFTAGLRFGPQ